MKRVIEAKKKQQIYTETVHYQIDDHLGSASLELNENAAITNCEEYHLPEDEASAKSCFGTTSYQKHNTGISQKRYKYVGKERDDETGLYYYGARYYAAWIARFVSVDPLQHEYPHYTPYQYAGNKPITFIDLDGLEEARHDINIVNTHKNLRDKLKNDRDIAETSFEKADKNLRNAENKLNSLNKEDSEYKDAKNEFKNAKSEYNKANKVFSKAENNFKPVNEKYEHVETAINNLFEYNNALYNDLNTLEDPLGNEVKVFIQAKKSLNSRDFKFSNFDISKGATPLKGFVEVKPLGSCGINQFGSNIVETVYTVQSRKGNNTILISLDLDLDDPGETLSHEGGHGKYEVGNLKKYIDWLKDPLNNRNSTNGHEGGNPSGKAADKQTEIYRMNKRKNE